MEKCGNENKKFSAESRVKNTRTGKGSAAFLLAHQNFLPKIMRSLFGRARQEPRPAHFGRPASHFFFGQSVTLPPPRGGSGKKISGAFGARNRPKFCFGAFGARKISPTCATPWAGGSPRPPSSHFCRPASHSPPPPPRGGGE